MATLELAIQIAAGAHQGQIDKAGEPYILHPLRLMLAVDTMDERIAAVLHDTVEDTAVTFDYLRRAGFSAEVIDAVRALTKKKGESRIEAARRAVENPIARQVKLADVADNMDMTRIPNPTQKDFDRIEQYKKVRRLLEAGPGN